MIPNNRQLAEGYGGHVMYHQELFVLPLMSMFSQDMSRSIINSRLRRGLNTDHMNMYEQARELAKQEGFVGLRYPWEQADYGVDVSPFADARKSKLHVSADISFGIRSYLRATHSREFLQQSVSPDVSLRGEEYLNEIAKYWSDRFEIEPTTNKYEIKSEKKSLRYLIARS
jgi:trehalose/maltose hydrolase-like predicted phosphorylase